MINKHTKPTSILLKVGSIILLSLGLIFFIQYKYFGEGSNTTSIWISNHAKFETLSITSKDKINNEEWGVAKLNHLGKSIKIWMKKEGDILECETRSKDHFLGFVTFKLIPMNRASFVAYLVEQHFLDKYDLIKVRKMPVNLKLQGAIQKKYLMIETPSKEVIERNRHKEGPIYSLINNALIILNKEYISDSISQKKIEEFVRLSVDEVVKGMQNPEEIFEIEKLAYLYALLDITGNLSKLNLYYNPTPSKIEPFHSGLLGLNSIIKQNYIKKINDNTDPFLFDVYKNRMFLEVYKKTIEDMNVDQEWIEITDKNNMNAHMKALHKILNVNRKIILEEITVHLEKLKDSEDNFEASKFSIFKENVLNSDKGYKFLEIDTINKKIKIKPGKWEIASNLIFPNKYSVSISAGTELVLKNGAVLYFHADLHMNGTKENGITVSSLGKPGAVVVMQAKNESRIEYTTFKNLGPAYIGPWSTTGAVTFYESDVIIEHSKFVDNKSEDSLNIVRSQFELRDSFIEITASDAFDGDFVTGLIERVTFLDLGNDGIDVSGSKIRVIDTKIKKAKDKGISAGEDSDIKARNVEVSDSAIGIAAKDKSTISISDSVIKNNQVGITAYIKKEEYGSAKVFATNMDIKNNKEDFLIEKKSTLILDGRKVDNDEKKIKKVMYGNQYGKASER